MENTGVRINKFLSEAGVCSRREADRKIENGEIRINDKIAVTGDKVFPEDVVYVNGRPVQKEEEMVLFALNKPVGIVCTAEKREKNNVIDFMKYPKRIYPIGRLDKVRDCFLFSCYTGLSFCDMATLSMDDIQTNGTVHYIKRNRAKTDVQYIIPLSDKAMSILVKYGFNLPVISNAKTNAYLKEIQTLAGIEKNLHFHLARHTALTLMLQNGIPIEIVSKIAGHTKIRQTQHYAKVMENTVLSYAANM